MFEDFFLEFEQPGWLFLALLILPTYLIARRSIGGLSPLKTHVTFAFRAVVLLLLAASLAQPSWLKKGEGLTVIAVVDRSRSVPASLQQQALDYLARATDPGGDVGRKDEEDRLAVVTVADGAVITALPSPRSTFDNFSDNLSGYEATNLQQGIERALAIAPDDTMLRIVLVSDGNETDGSLIDAVKRVKANGIPIDVLPQQYQHNREVLFDRLVAPARARRGQVTSLRLIVRSQAETSGMLTLRQNGEDVDLNGDDAGVSARVELQAGVNSFPVPILFDNAGPQQFEASFEPDNPADDPIVENNSAMAVTFVAGEGRVLVLDESISESAPLVDALRDSKLTVDVLPPGAVDNVVTLGGYDAVILVNQAYGQYGFGLDDWLHDYVHDLGGGLIVTGGPDALGAGGWINSKVEEALPVKLDPPQNLVRQRGALAIIMHSCEMPQANYWGVKIAESAINALTSEDYIGILDYNWNNGGCVWEWGPAPAGDKSGPLAAARAMPVGDMPDFQTAMSLALNGLNNLPKSVNKHVIITSDGDPSPPTTQLLQQFVASKITVTTVLLAGHGGPGTMKTIAQATGGQFYNPTNPRSLPEIIITEAKIVARSLIVEGENYLPNLVNSAVEPIRGFNDLPPVQGYVLTAPREGLAEIPFTTVQNGDPIYANWHYGIGKAIVFTPDVTSRWATAWMQWDRFRGFWDQSVRWAMRPVSPSNMTVNTHMEGDRAVVEVEALDTDESFLNNLSSVAAILGPDGTQPLSLQQTGPGKYRGEFVAHDAGAYLVNMNFRKGAELVGNVQAAVNVPYAKEYRTLRDNTALLMQAQADTGGRVLPANPLLADVWNRNGLDVRKSHLPIWDLLAIIAATLFLLDVAARRLSIGIAEMRAAARRMFGKRDDVSEDTVAAWKKAREQVAHRRSSPDDADAASPEVDRTVKFEADEADAATAIDVGTDATVRIEDRPQQPTRRAVKPQEATDDEGDFTSRLLAAKRRAREQQQGGSDEVKGADGG